jgi:hypothetical protein
VKTHARRGSGPVSDSAAAWRPARVTRPGDPLEREAERMAERALEASPGGPATASRAPAGTVMRQASDDDRRRPIYEEDEDYDVAASSRSSSPPAAPRGFLDAVRTSGGGQSLSAPVRHRMEHGFGRRFDRVRVHHDAESARLSHSIGAHAFAHEQHIFFDRGEYRPGTPGGDRLIAHELAHTLQRPGAGTVARQKKKQPAPQYDPSRMTDEQKIELRTWIRESAAYRVRKLRQQFDDAKAPKFDAAKRSAWIRTLDAAIANGQTITDQNQRAGRLAWLRAAKQLFGDPFWTWAFLRGQAFFIGGEPTVQRMGDPSVTMPAAELASIASEVAAMTAGAESFLRWLSESQKYEELGLDPKQLETAEVSQAEQGAGGGVKGGTGVPQADPSGAVGGANLEQRKQLEQMYDELTGLETEPAPGDSEQLARELEKLTHDERKAFYEFVKKTVESGDTGKTLVELLEAFNKLDPASREALRINREIAEQEPARGEGVPERVLVKLKREIAETQAVADSARSIQSNLDIIRSLTKDPEAQKELAGLDFGFSPFFDETTMLLGLLNGASDESTLVEQVAQELVKEVEEFRDRLQRELLELAAESAGMVLLTAVTQGAASPALLLVLRKIKKVKDLIETLQRIYNVYTRIERVFKIVEGAGESYASFRIWFDNMTAHYAKLEAELGKIDSSEDVEELLEAREEQLLEELDKQLEGKLGELLEMMYIPEDTPPEELRKILFNIPRGITALESMWSYYHGGESGKPHFAEVLGLKALDAGRLLYPLVGLTAALIAEQLQATFQTRTVEDRINRLISKSKRGPGLRGRNRGLFGRLRRKNYDYDVADLMPHLLAAREALAKAIDEDEPGSGRSEHWTRAWFKYVVRREIKEVNQKLKGKTVPAERKTKGADGRTTKVREDVPLPPVRVRLKRPLFGSAKLKAEVKLNPDLPVEVYQLTSDDFGGDGVAFDPPAERQEAIRKWLRDAGYDLTKDPAGNEHIRLPGAKKGDKDRPYLHFAGGRIKAGIDPKAWKAFENHVVGDSRDLPEGYHMYHKEGRDIVSLKPGAARLGLVRLGLNEHHKLVEGTTTAPPKEIAKPGVVKATYMESFSYLGPIDTMFAPKTATGPEYNLQKKDRGFWTRLVERQPELQKRPKAVKGRFGYIMRARAFGDNLGSRHIPELQTRDDKGHLVARRFGGVDDYGNLVPMLRSENQAPGSWYRFESDMAEVYVGKKAEAGHYVEFEASLFYPTPATRRPNKFVARFQHKDAKDQKVGGQKTRTVDNE